MRRTVFTDEHEEFRGTVRAFIRDEVVPEYSSWEEAGRPSRRFWRRAGELGILGIGVPGEFGGMAGSSFTHSVVVTEEIQRELLALGGLRVQTDICMPYLLKYSTSHQMDRWLPGIVSGNTVLALGLSEPEAGSDLKSLATRAERDGDEYVVNGSKTFISNGAGADLVILAVKTAPDAGRDGISLLVVDSRSEGFRCGRSLDKLGLKAQDLAELSFTDMRVPRDNLLGEENHGFAYLTSNLSQERLSIGINSQAAARSALSMTVSMLSELKKDQRAKFDLATSATEADAGQALADASLVALEDGSLTIADAAKVKLFCTEMQGRVTDRCLRLLGPGEFAHHGRIGQAYLDARVSRIYGGSSEIMKVLIAQSLGA